MSFTLSIIVAVPIPPDTIVIARLSSGYVPVRRALPSGMAPVRQADGQRNRAAIYNELSDRDQAWR